MFQTRVRNKSVRGAKGPSKCSTKPEKMLPFLFAEALLGERLLRRSNALHIDESTVYDSDDGRPQTIFCRTVVYVLLKKHKHSELNTINNSV